MQGHFLDASTVCVLLLAGAPAEGSRKYPKESQNSPFLLV